MKQAKKMFLKFRQDGRGNIMDDNDKPIIIIVNNTDRGRWFGGGGFGRIGCFLGTIRRIISIAFFWGIIAFIIICLTKPQIIYEWFLFILQKLGLGSVWRSIRRYL
jgi:hypothetical protein